MTDQLLFAVEDGIATITLSRPERMNAFTFEMIDAWVERLAEVRTNDAIKVLVVTGAGKAFCAGGDIVEMKDRLAQTPLQRKNELWTRIQRIPLSLEDLDKPVLMAVNGAATGAGMDLALQGDLRYAAEGARFAETYVRVGLVPGAGGTWYLPRVVGVAKALELFWTADFVEGAEAERIGLVNKVVPADELLPHVYGVARKIAGSATLAARLIKRAVYQGLRVDLRTSLDMISSHYAVVTAGHDHREAVEAFIEKRKPEFEGR
ncbi:MAG: enoyl-CoA hydratase/isomerase family protein [Alphaproteobacteria bacterium]